MRPEITWGLISGTGVCLWIALGHQLGTHTSSTGLGTYSGILSNLIPLTALFLLLRAKRARLYDGRLSLAAGIGSGVFMSFVASLVVYSFLATYSHFINPTWIDQMLEVRVAQQRATGLSEAVIQERILATRDDYSPVGLLRTIILSTTLMGGLYALAVTLLVRQLPHQEKA